MRQLLVKILECLMRIERLLVEIKKDGARVGRP